MHFLCTTLHNSYFPYFYSYYYLYLPVLAAAPDKPSALSNLYIPGFLVQNTVSLMKPRLSKNTTYFTLPLYHYTHILIASISSYLVFVGSLIQPLNLLFLYYFFLLLYSTHLSSLQLQTCSSAIYFGFLITPIIIYPRRYLHCTYSFI